MNVILCQPAARSESIEANFAHLHEAWIREAPEPGDADLVLLPELIGATSSRERYLECLRDFAALTGCTVVGGSHHDSDERGIVNRGAIIQAPGHVLAEYEKLKPYFMEIDEGVVDGLGPCCVEIDGRRVAVLICSDLWYSAALAKLPGYPDIILCPSCSVSQRASPLKSKSLWRHMSAARAYEFVAYVAVSDWADSCEYAGLPCSGVSGVADPWPKAGEFFNPVGDQVFSSFELDLDRLDRFRENRIERGSFLAVK